MSDFITNAELRIEAEWLCDENDRLAKQVEADNEQIGELQERVNVLNTENAMLRELCKSMRCALAGFGDKVYLAALDETLIKSRFDLQKLGIEVEDVG